MMNDLNENRKANNSSGGSGGSSSSNNSGGSGTGSGSSGPGGPAGVGGTGMNPFMGTPYDPEEETLELLINYNEKFKDSTPIKFRDDVIDQTISCLVGKMKPNALLVGAAGVGKTKIAEDIARRLANDDPTIPSTLKGFTVYELMLSSLVSNSSLLGQLESKVISVIDFATDPKNKAIIFIDEIHMLFDSTYDKIAQILKPALARGDMRVIGSTTLQESQSLIADPAFNRRFTRITIDELSQSQTVEILDSLYPTLFDHYDQKVMVNPALLPELVTIADEYKNMSAHRPDNAITLLDRTMADALVQRHRDTAELMAQPQTPQTQQLLSAMQQTCVHITIERIKKTALNTMTGGNKKEAVNIDKLRDNLSVIKGQDECIDFLLDTIERDELSLYPRSKPLTFLFAGHSGVGKSEIAKITAQSLTGTKPIILNMTEYNSSASIARLIGAPAGYVGYSSKAELPFDILESNPYQVILLDEFEKSDKSVQRLFMSAFDEGYFKTSKGNIVDFSKAIIIATTNAGCTTERADTIGFTQAKDSNNSTVMKLSNFFDIELLNRFTKIINFNAISESVFKEIVADTYRRDIARIKTNHSSYSYLNDELTDDEVNEITKEHFNKLFGARPIKRVIQKRIEDAELQHRRAAKANKNATVNAATN